ncbi:MULTISPECIES: polysaccharide biosynthesis protein [unclassified Moorena]|uniref:polysaccharide biosynthesis protein n=2 Tax=Moorena TaxID=1155738 RepID=UPI0013FEFC34|nr:MULTISPECIES: polysaccharide biosynthesis protein [unclassified Moorena]NEO14785.1 polysaccharide biosynthesis protein [Moorena sp. SIO3E8]NEQ01183.1 polysaccharide biosynthesis protein [Moorena sp. SIO3F7]
MTNNLSNWLLGLRNRHFLLIDLIIFTSTPVLALVLFLNNHLDINPYQSGLILATILFLIVKLTVFSTFGLYKRCWSYASIDELEHIAALTAAAIVIQTLLFHWSNGLTNLSLNSLPNSLPLLDGILSLLFVGSLRFSVRAVERVSQRHRKFHRRDNVLIVGAGSAGVALAQDMQKNPSLGFNPVAFIDDDRKKLNLRIRRLPIVGNRDAIPDVVRSLRIRKIIIAMPTAPGRVIREVLDICKSTGVPTSTLPGMNEILNNPIRVGSVRDVKIEDLLRREPIQTDVQRVAKFLKGKIVLVTGAGGSIGSELCRQIFKCQPSEMVLLGHGENSVFHIQQELNQVLELLEYDRLENERLPNLNTIIADIRLTGRLEYIFDQFRPDIVFHAAAHKHVPMMELNPPEAITNNVLGTKNLLDLSLRYGVEHFVMISTDKAVNPTNVMGCSKRVAEMLVLQAAQRSGRHFSVVRFGNVLGSRGSVVPTFKRQIAAGGPVTVTHPDICRYFMTIPEAVQLVLQASVIGQGGEVFMLNMGQPVKIVDLAKELIRLSGYEVGKDIDIVFSGLRPGEKLFEELLIPGEEYEPTLHDKLLVVKNASHMVSKNLDYAVDALRKAADQNYTNLILFLLEQLVPGYTPKYKKTTPILNFYSDISKMIRTDDKIKVLDKCYHQANGQVTQSKKIGFWEMEDYLQKALKNQELQLYYQPIMLLENEHINSFEALLRWQHPNLGLIYPEEFMPVAKATSLIVPIGWWVIREVCNQLQSWQQLFPSQTPITISVNLCRQQLLQPDLVQQIDHIINKTNLDAYRLKLEIPESFIRKNPEEAMVVLSKLRAIGVQLELDNFGINTSSDINYIHEVSNSIYGEFNGLKVDRSLVSKINTDNINLEPVQTVAKLANDLGVDLIATGVETSRQIDQLKILNCKYGQGYFFSKPVDVEAAITLIGV